MKLCRTKKGKKILWDGLYQKDLFEREIVIKKKEVKNESGKRIRSKDKD